MTVHVEADRNTQDKPQERATERQRWIRLKQSTKSAISEHCLIINTKIDKKKWSDLEALQFIIIYKKKFFSLSSQIPIILIEFSNQEAKKKFKFPTARCQSLKMYIVHIPFRCKFLNEAAGKFKISSRILLRVKTNTMAMCCHA